MPPANTSPRPELPQHRPVRDPAPDRSAMYHILTAIRKIHAHSAELVKKV